MKQLKQKLLLICLILSTLPAIANAGNYINLRFTTDKDINGYKVYNPPTMRSNLPDNKFTLYANQERQGYFEEIQYNEPESYLILRLEANEVAICDIEIKPGKSKEVTIIAHPDQHTLVCHYEERKKLISIGQKI